MSIHPSAIVSPKAEIDSTAEVGPFAIIGDHVKVGPGCVIQGHATVENRTTLNENVVIHPYARIGGVPQDLKFNGEPAELHIGARTTIREGVTINIGTEHGGLKTIVGEDCLIMAYAHIAHDCRLMNGVIIVNSVSVAGHVTIHDHAIVGGLAGIHQFVNIGERAFIAAGSMVSRDVLPYTTVQGDRAMHIGLNLVGLKRAGWERSDIRELRDTFKEMQTSGDAMKTVIAKRLALHDLAALKRWQSFIEATQRGVAPVASEARANVDL